uniref:Mediator of RNA polymerase II transcription subunit 28 n=2 Tax=Strigamia maritima TaxID=126957 RepID=T1IIE0_STRMM
MARHMECFFLQKRLLLSAQKPEQILREDINELKLELTRKEQLIQKHYEKIQYWQGLLSDLQGPGRPPQPPPPLTAQLSGPPQPPMVQQQVPNMSTQVMRSAMPSMQPPQMYGHQPPPGNPHMVPSQMGQQNPTGMMQSPLAYLEKTTSNIGMNDLRRQ